MSRKTDARSPREIAEGVYYLPVRGVNVYFVRSGSSWVLIDTAWPKNGRLIREAAASLFGENARPAAIMLTHVHPDHQGSAAELARLWELPVYVHGDDLPLLAGEVADRSSLDPIGRFFLALMRLLPRRTVERLTASELTEVACALPEQDAGVPGLPDWECVPTPGHSPGHSAFFRRSDRVLIAGDAVLTAPFWGLASRRQRISRPPYVSGWNWRRTKDSFAALAKLEPRVLATGHGVPLTGAGVARDLHAFADRFSPVPRRAGA